MEEVVDIAEETHPKRCDKSMSKMADWMMQQGHIPQGGKRATSQATLFCTKNLSRESVDGACQLLCSKSPALDIKI
jgi:hypothetical protein